MLFTLGLAASLGVPQGHQNLLVEGGVCSSLGQHLPIRPDNWQIMCSCIEISSSECCAMDMKCR